MTIFDNIFADFYQFPLTTSEMELDYFHQKVDIKVAPRVAEQLKGTVIAKLYNNKYMIASTQISTEIFAFIAVVAFKLLSRKVLFIDRNVNRNY